MLARVALLPLLLGCEQDYEVVPKPVDVNPGDITECGFTRVEDTAFYRYDCNPVFSTTGEDWADTIRGTTFLVTEVLGHPFYQLWYTGVTDDPSSEAFGLGYAVSPDGTEWTPHKENPLLEEPEDRLAWDADAMDGMAVVWDPQTEQYVNLYQGYNIEGTTPWGLGVATSPDGVSWRRIDANPVVNLSEAHEGVRYCWPLGLTLGDIAGYTGYVAGARNTGHCEVYRINAANVSDWTPSTDLVFAVGERGEWDDEGFSSLAIADLKGTRYVFYVGFDDWEDHDTYRSALHPFLGMAIARDGEWVREGGIIPVHNTEEGAISAVAARTVGSRIHLWITDDYDGVSAVGYFLFDPEAAAAEDGEGGE